MTSKFRKPWLLVLLAAGLVFAVVLQWVGARSISPPRAGVPPPAELLPHLLAGWQITDRPVADSPEEKAAVNELLNYDDAVFRIFQKGNVSFAVYLAHWNPGKMSPRLIAAHTPDVCWPALGWNRDLNQEQKLGVDGMSEAGSVRALVARAGLAPGEFRVFAGHETLQHVLFWQVNGDEIVNYDTGFAPPWYAMFTDLAKNGLNQRREQWFIRISSSVAFPLLARETGFQFVLSRLAQAGLERAVK